MGATILQGDCRVILPTLAAGSIHCVVTSPPYFGLRDYKTATWEGGNPSCDHLKVQDGQRAVAASTLAGGKRTTGHLQEGYKATCGRCGALRVDRQIGLEVSPVEYVQAMVEVFRHIWRVLRDDGTAWLNLGDSYSGSGKGAMGDGSAVGGPKQSTNWGTQDGVFRRTVSAGTLKDKDLIGIPWRVAFALQEDGWYLRSAITWCKTAPMPESVTDRPTSATEMLFLLAKSPRYFYDSVSIAEPAMGTGGGPFSQNTHNARLATMSGGTPATQRHDGATRNKRNWWVINPKPFTGWTQTSRRVRVEAGDADDGMERIVSPDCPVHGDRPVRAATPQRDEHAGVQLPHSRGNAARRGPTQPPLFSPTDQPPCANFEGGSLDCLPPGRDSSATRHNSGSHKRGHVPATTLPYMPSAQTSESIGHKPNLPAVNVPDQSKDGSNNETRALGDHSPECSPCHSVHKSSESPPSSCTCSFYKTTTTSISHFAVMPGELVEPCVLAGTSAHGCCPKCSAPWQRAVETMRAREGKSPVQEGRTAAAAGNTSIVSLPASMRTDPSRSGMGTPTIKTVGWEPTCKCGRDDVVPCVVLDPFAGAGTVPLVAASSGRNAIGIELNPEYCDMARNRLGLLLDESAERKEAVS